MGGSQPQAEPGRSGANRAVGAQALKGANPPGMVATSVPGHGPIISGVDRTSGSGRSNTVLSLFDFSE